MHVAHFIPAIVPVLRYGGTERAAYWNAEEQAAMGHRITILSKEGSSVPFGTWKTMPTNSDEWKSLLEKSHVDIVHFHTLPPDSFPKEFPHLVSVQGNGRPGEIFPRNSVFVSRNHAERHASTYFVHNGIKLDLYPLKTSKKLEGNAMFLAKASWSVKNLRGSLKIARAASKRLLVAGGRRPLAPWGLFATHGRFFGNADDKLKIKLLHQSDALLFPVLWHEPFGIAVIEALACGVPVVASAFGSLPEIVTPECGLVSNSSREMAAFLKDAVPSLDPEACRARVETHFSAAKMARSYLELYAQVIEKGFLSEKNPRTLGDTFLCSLDQRTETSSSR
ncbi:MAG: glycosyltransferase [Bdellovibrionota bacterium]